MTLTEHVALVTGAGRGIGGACAEALAKAGAAGVAGDIAASRAAKAAEALTAAGHRCLAVAADCGNLADIERMVAAATGAYGAIDILVNNAGVTRRVDIMEITEADWDRIHRVNAKGVFFCLQAVARTMIPR